MTNEPLRIAFAGGGTGGHIVPGMHLLERARQGDPALPSVGDLLWFTSGREVEDRVLAAIPADFPWQRQILQLEPAVGGAPGIARLLLKTPGAWRVARRRLREHRTQVLLGLGGFTTLPAVLAARSLNIPVALLEINASAGQATRSLARFADKIFHAWQGTLPPGGESSRDLRVGAPVSPAVVAVGLGKPERAQALKQLDMDPKRPLLLVLGGSQGAGSLNEFMGKHATFFAERGIQVLHQCGPGKRGALPTDSDALRIVEYLSPMAPALQAASLVLCRGGASTLAEIAAARRAALVVPFPNHADRHQERNAQELGAGVQIVPDGELHSACAERIVHLLMESGRSEVRAMQAALGALAPPDAAARILLELQKIAR